MRRVFVYGTLRVGMYNYEYYYKAHDTFRRYAYVKGSLHAIRGKAYPALTIGDEMVLGEIHEVPDDVQNEVDLMEGFFGEDRIENEYDKVFCTIYDDLGEEIDHLPVYFYNLRNPENRKLIGDVISCNDYVKYLEIRKTEER